MALIEAFNFTVRFNSRIIFLQDLCDILSPTWKNAREVYLETAFRAFKKKNEYNSDIDFDQWLTDILFEVVHDEATKLQFAA